MTWKVLLVSTAADADDDTNDRVSVLFRAMEESDSAVKIYSLEKVFEEAKRNQKAFSVKLQNMIDNEFNRILFINSENLKKFLNGDSKIANELLQEDGISTLISELVRKEANDQNSRIILLSLEKNSAAPERLKNIIHIQSILNEGGAVVKEIITEQIIPKCRNDYVFISNENKKNKKDCIIS